MSVFCLFRVYASGRAFCQAVSARGSVVFSDRLFVCDTVPAAYPEQKSVRNVRAHREIVIHIECTQFLVLGRIVTDVSTSKMSRFSRNMPAYKSVLSGFKTKT